MYKSASELYETYKGKRSLDAYRVILLTYCKDYSKKGRLTRFNEKEAIFIINDYENDSVENKEKELGEKLITAKEIIENYEISTSAFYKKCLKKIEFKYEKNGSYYILKEIEKTFKKPDEKLEIKRYKSTKDPKEVNVNVQFQVLELIKKGKECLEDLPMPLSKKIKESKFNQLKRAVERNRLGL